MTNHENFSSLGLMDMVRKPIHPSTAFYPLKRGGFQPEFFGNNWFSNLKKAEGRRENCLWIVFDTLLPVYKP
ncbi:MAG: hypothetical protein F6K39_34405 [Okeania sp. SIO3B3]|nr:hypothetical protein [Okeania sp. SIO3B3]